MIVSSYTSADNCSLADVLGKKVLRGPFHVLVREGGHEVVAVVVVGLHAQVDALVVACLLGRGNEVLRKQLLLLVEVVAGTLDRREGG